MRAGPVVRAGIGPAGPAGRARTAESRAGRARGRFTGLPSALPESVPTRNPVPESVARWSLSGPGVPLSRSLSLSGLSLCESGCPDVRFCSWLVLFLAVEAGGKEKPGREMIRAGLGCGLRGVLAVGADFLGAFVLVPSPALSVPDLFFDQGPAVGFVDQSARLAEVLIRVRPG